MQFNLVFYSVASERNQHLYHHANSIWKNMWLALVLGNFLILFTLDSCYLSEGDLRS